jgi:predicted flavoprotein YhiN
LPDGHFLITTQDNEYHTKKLIIASWGMTYPQVGATPFGYEIAEQLWLNIAAPHGALCGIETPDDFSSLAWNTIQSELSLYGDNKLIYKNKWSLLFTHRGISGPIVFDATLYMDQDISKYSFQLDFDLSGTSKKVIQAFTLIPWDTVRDFRVKALRPIEEAKVSVGGVLLWELDQHFQSKKIPGLYFIWEALDITWKTWGYNLQRAWSSAYVCAGGNLE